MEVDGWRMHSSSSEQAPRLQVCHPTAISGRSPAQSEYAELFGHIDVVAGSDFPLAQSLDRKRGVVLFYCCAFFHPDSH